MNYEELKFFDNQSNIIKRVINYKDSITVQTLKDNWIITESNLLTQKLITYSYCPGLTCLSKNSGMKYQLAIDNSGQINFFTLSNVFRNKLLNLL